MERQEPVGVIGLGLMGTAITQRLMGAGYAVVGTDVDAKARARFAGLGGQAVGSVGDVAGLARHVVLAVFDTGQVEDVVEGAKGLLSVPADKRQATAVLNTSTCDPDRIAALAGRIASRGLTLVEVPVSGSSDQVARGDGVGLIAGDKAALDGAAGVVKAIAPRTFYMGEVGNGLRAKLAINHILGLNRAALAEGLVYSGKLGLPLDAFLDAAKGSAAYSQVMDIKGRKMVEREFSTQGKVVQSLKDFDMIVQTAAAKGQVLPLATIYADLMRGCVAAGEGEADNSSIICEIARRTTKGA